MSERFMLDGPHGQQWPAPEVGERVHVAAYYYPTHDLSRPFVLLTRDLDGDCEVREIATGAVETRDIFELMLESDVDRHTTYQRQLATRDKEERP